jgi:hypothetical protein
MKCTVSTEQRRTWKEYQSGTRSRILLACPHCQAWVSPEREHLTGWQGAETQTAARRTSSFACPACGEFWNDADRVTADADCQLIHLGQDLDEQGNLQGESTETERLGFRWSESVGAKYSGEPRLWSLPRHDRVVFCAARRSKATNLVPRRSPVSRCLGIQAIVGSARRLELPTQVSTDSRATESNDSI